MKKTLSFLAFAISLSFISCDDESDVGLALQNNDDLLNTSLIDTLTLELNSVLFNETIKTDSTYVLLFGSFQEPSAGITNAKTYFQVVPKFNRGNIAVDGAVYDSAVFEMEFYYSIRNDKKFPSVYGDTLTSIDLQLNELSSSLENIEYSSTSTIPTNGVNLITNPTIHINPYTASSITVPLDNSYGQTLFDEYIDSTNFLKTIKGFELSTTSANAIVGLASYNSNTRITLYFHMENNPTVPIASSLLISQNSVRFNNITSDFSGTELSGLTSNGDSYNPTDIVYLKNGVGLGLHVGIPTLNTLMTNTLSGATINKAELVFTLAKSYTDFLSAPSEFVSVYKSSQTEITPIINDGTPEGVGLDVSTSPVIEVDIEEEKYTIPLTSHFQQMAIANEAVTDFFIFPFGNSSLVNTTALGGVTNSNQTLRPQLKIYYTK